MSFCRAVPIAALLVLIAPVESFAHPPYERRIARVKGPTGEIEVVKSFIDGIIAADPSKVVLRSAGVVTAETPYFRDAAVLCLSDRCIIAASDSSLGVTPDRVWVVRAGSLQPADTFLMHTLGGVVHLWDHSVGYAVAALFALILIVGMRELSSSSPDTILASCLAAAGIFALPCLAVMWLYVVLMLSELSLLWALLATAVALAALRGVARASKFPRLRASTAGT